MQSVPLSAGLVLLAGASAAAAPSVVITEIMYNPASTETRGQTEWVEIANAGTIEITIKQWRLKDQHSRPADAWSPFDVILPPGGIAVLVNSAAVTPAQFREAWDASPGQPETYAVIPITWGALTNQAGAGKEKLQLLDDKGELVCEVAYQSGGEWPEITGKGGPSVWLADLAATDLSAGVHWRASVEGKDGSRRSRATDVFGPDDVGSPGYVPGVGPAPPPSPKPAASDKDKSKPKEPAKEPEAPADTPRKPDDGVDF